MSEGWKGWDEYAAYYDWENARTLGRRDLPFWRRLLVRERAPVLELGCGTGRLIVPLARDGVRMTGIDRSTPMLERARNRARRLPRSRRPRLARGDIRHLPFPSACFGVVMAPYGLLQSLIDDADLSSAMTEIARVLRPGGLLGVDLVPDLASWPEYERRVSLTGRAAGGATVTLIESVRRNRRRRLIIFDEEFVERRRGEERRRQFSLTFRTLSLPEVTMRVVQAGFEVEATAGDYRGGAWTPGSAVWLVLARKTGRQ
jgi:SAM-dependent methyltransferase